MLIQHILNQRIILFIFKIAIAFGKEEPINIFSSIDIDFIQTKGLTLLPGHLVNIVKNGTDFSVDVNTNCNIYSGLFAHKKKKSHDYKYTRQSVRFNNVVTSDENYVPYNNAISFFEEQANKPYRPQTSDTVTGIANTTITYSRIDELILPEKAYYWEYEGTECARPDLVTQQAPYSYYISSIQYGSASHFDVAFEYDQLLNQIYQNICTAEQEEEYAYLDFPEPKCIQRDTVLTTINPDCSSKCESRENLDTCQENEIGVYIVKNGLLTFDEFSQILIRIPYNLTAHEQNGVHSSYSELYDQLQYDLYAYHEWKCAQQCVTDIDCTLSCTMANHSQEFYNDLYSFLLGIGKIQEDHIDRIIEDFRGYLGEQKYKSIKSDYCIDTCYSNCALLRSKVKINWNILLNEYANFFDPIMTKLRVVAYPLSTEANFDKIHQLIETLDTIARDTSDHRPLKMFLKPIPEIMVPGREDDFGPPAPVVGNFAIDFPDEENYLFNITLDKCVEDDCTKGLVNPHQEDLLRMDVPVTTEYTWIWQNHNPKLVDFYFTRFADELTVNPGHAISLDFNAVDIYQIYLIFTERYSGGLMSKETNKEWRKTIPKWKCLGKSAGSVVGIGSTNRGDSRGDYYYCSYMIPKGDGMMNMRTPVFKSEFRGFLAYTTPSISVDQMGADTVDVNGNPIHFVNPLPPAAFNDWFSKVEIDGIDVGYSEAKLSNDIPVTSFIPGFSDDVFTVKLRRPGFNDNDFIKFDSPTILPTNSNIRVSINTEKMVAYKNFQIRLLIASLDEDQIDCPIGYNSMSPRAGIFNLGYAHNWDSKFARGCKKRVKLANNNMLNVDRGNFSLTTTSRWIVVISVYGHIKNKYLETTSDNLLLRTAYGNRLRYSGQGQNRFSRMFRSRRLKRSMDLYPDRYDSSMRIIHNLDTDLDY